ncbi:hypothetical protein BP5796_06364 [Coleophoma crateriformis]|uniref:Uncharacterized protein n=1 Tax=Coleophoma crateriformis TaxID=565419 RepID=A0A3D8RWQ2_9HELO|nr:hypothetical protein BP5796_06364 [Coleophoma crateriformis]
MDDLPPPPYSVHDTNPPSSAQYPTSPFIGRVVIDRSEQGPRRSQPVSNTSLPDTPVPVGTPTPAQAPNFSVSDLEHSGFVSASPYFELRQPLGPRPAQILTAPLNIGPGVSVESIPFPHPANIWEQRGIDQQDWITFLNHLKPVNDTQSRAPTRQKDLELLSEAGQQDALYPSQLRPNEDGEKARLHHVKIKATIAQWNHGFFLPRSVEVIPVFGSNASNAQRLGHRQAGGYQIASSSDRASGWASRLGSMFGIETPTPVQPVVAHSSPQEETLLHNAISKGSRSIAKMLLEQGHEDIEALNEKGETVLYAAVCRGEKGLVQLLLDHNADPTAHPQGSNLPLYIAATRDRKSILKLLLKRSTAGINEISTDGETALFRCVRRSYSSCAELLLESGANPNIRQHGEVPLLHIAAKKGEQSLMKPLLKHGCDVEEKNHEGDTPLCAAVKRSATSVVKLLLQHHATVSVRSGNGEYPLSIATSRGNTSIVSLLLAQPDVEIEVRDSAGLTPLHIAIARGDTSIVTRLLRESASPDMFPTGAEPLLSTCVSKGNTSMTHLLLESGANPNIQNSAGLSPLAVAVNKGDVSICSLLLNKGADPDVTFADGDSLLYRCVLKGNTSIVHLLLESGAHADAQGGLGERCLWKAVEKSNTSIVSLLLNRGANPSATSLLGETCLQKAVARGDTSIVHLLLAKLPKAGVDEKVH